MTSEKLKIVVFLDPGLPYAPTFLEKVAQNPVLRICKIFLRQHKKSRYSTLLRTIQQSGWRYTIDRSIALLKLKECPPDKKLMTAEELCSRFTIPHQFIWNCNQPEVIAEIKQDGIDLILTPLYTQIVKADLRAAPKLGCVNLHPSLLPRFRGTNPVYWALAENAPETGLTLHLIDEGLDTGKIVSQIAVPILRSDTHDALYRRIVECGAELLETTLLKIAAERAVTSVEQPQSDRPPYPAPTRESYRQFRKLGRSFID